MKILLENREIKSREEIAEFLNPKPAHKLVAEDFAISSANLKKIVKRIKSAIKNQERIIVWGDYDADGISATALVWEALAHNGAQVLPYIPSRFNEGYGLNEEGIKKLFGDRKGGLLITVDNGIVAHQEVKLAKKLGVTVIITDHHLAEEKKPAADFILHSTKTSGSGLAWLLAREFEAADLALATLGILADMVPLRGVNRSLAKEGLKAFSSSSRLGLTALLQKTGLAEREISAWDIYFIIGPRLNAVGRMSEALDSLRLLCTENLSQAYELALRIEQLNKERQRIMDNNLNLAKKWLSKQKKLPDLIFVSDREYHQGVIGLVSGRLTEEFCRPSVVVHQGKKFSKASARSLNGFNIVEAIRKHDKFLKDVGGHPLAAGFTVENKYLEKLKRALLKEVKLFMKKHNGDALAEKKVDFEVKLAWLNLGFCQMLNKLKPYGFANSEPTFLLKGVRVLSLKTVGNNGGHLKIWLDDPGTKIVERQTAEAIGFRMGDWINKLLPGDVVDLIFNAEINEWQGRKSLQLKVKDLEIANQDGQEKN